MCIYFRIFCFQLLGIYTINIQKTVMSIVIQTQEIFVAVIQLTYQSIEPLLELYRQVSNLLYLYQKLKYLFFLLSLCTQELLLTPNIVTFLSSPLPSDNEKTCIQSIAISRIKILIRIRILVNQTAPKKKLFYVNLIPRL